LKIDRLLARRTDLSTFLVHLSRASDEESAKDRLISIVKSRSIEARSPYGPAVPRLEKAKQPTESQKCVCFTETPLEHVHILTSQIEERNFHFEPYGIAISKKQGRKNGVNPVWYLDISPGHDWLTQPLEKMIDEAIDDGEYAGHPLARLTPFIEQMGSGGNESGIGGYRKEFWWEREWRHQGDFKIRSKPIIICPAKDIRDVREAISQDEMDLNDDLSFIDPNWSLEQIIGRLAGLKMADLGAF
jgi:hypothetical protein